MVNVANDGYFIRFSALKEEAIPLNNRDYYHTQFGYYNTEFATLKETSKMFNKLKNEKCINTEWAEMYAYPECAEDDFILIESFERQKTTVFRMNILGNIIDEYHSEEELVEV